MDEEVTLEKLPIHKLRSALKEKGIKFKTTDKKADLIYMLETGETTHKPRKAKKAPTLQEQKTERAVPLIPKEIKADLEALQQKGLRWEIDEESGCINFFKDIPTCANLDQPAHNILRTARESFYKARPIETGKRNPGEPVEWMR